MQNQCAQRAARLRERTGGIASFVVPALLALALAPLIASAAPASNAIHPLIWSDRVVADSSGAEMPQDASMPCMECHDMGNPDNSSINSFSTARTDGVTITTVRQLCEGCHHPSDAPGDPVVVRGLVLAPLPGGLLEHTDADTSPCSDCHGASGHKPVAHVSSGQDCTDSACHGGSGSHGIHIVDSDARGPGALACTYCHQAGDYPFFNAGSDRNKNGHIELGETTVCDACHSPGGSYDGVDSALAPSGAMSIGAKDHWASRVYASATALQAGKERWCVGCHDGVEAQGAQAASLIGGVYAPPVAGDESASYVYGTGWGFYETGHGTPTSATLPSSGYYNGPGLECDDCHDNTQTHIDGERRTYTHTADNYRTGYRLSLVGGEDPMDIPRTDWGHEVIDFKLCIECHPADRYLDTLNTETNFINNSGTNMHAYHTLGAGSHKNRWDSDWDGAGNDSYMSCPTCHNVHGSTYMAMITDGELISDTIDRRPGLRMWYWDDTISVWNEGNTDPPQPEDVTMAMSDGWVWRPATSSNVCVHCHGNDNTIDYPRTLWTDFGLVPTLTWTGEPGYESDAHEPDSGTAADPFTFRIVYTDGNNDAPTHVTLLLDRNDDGDLADAGEQIPMDPDDPGDVTYYNGNGYHADVTINRAGDDTLLYRFATNDGSSVGISDAGYVTITNAIPRLLWTGEVGYGFDGVNPNGGQTGVMDYEFRVLYQDADGEAPSGGVTLYADKNDDGDFADPSEVTTMTDMGDPDCVVGKRYTHTTKLTYSVDGLIPYYFEASDGDDTGQSAVMTATVHTSANQAPALAWTGEPEYVTDGVDPENQAATKPFFFRTRYSDADDDAPGVAQVWVDLDDDGAYEPGERFPMDEPVTSSDPDMVDGDYTDGEFFAGKVYVPYAGDGTLSYRFYFEDAKAADATGVQETDRTLSVFHALDVPAEYATIQAAVDAASAGDTILVADGTYAGWAQDSRDITVDSVNGPSSTFVEEPGGQAIRFNPSRASDATITALTIRDSRIGLYNYDSVVRVVDCVFEDNERAFYTDSPGAYPLTIDSCTITGSTLGAIRTSNNTCIVDVTDTVFSGNNNTGDGGALTGNGGNFTFDGCVFDGNSATNGGAIAAQGIIQLVVRDSVFTNNTADPSVGHGGAIYFVGNTGSTDAWIDRTVFAGNQAKQGGAMEIRLGDYAITNCMITGNYAASLGGGVRTYYAARPIFTNCTISGNSAYRGGGIFSYNNGLGQCDVHNCIVWGNESRGYALQEIDSTNLSNVEVQYTDINQAYTGFASQTGNMNADPLYVSAIAPASAPTTTGDYHIQVGSPVEGQASATYAPADDIDRGVRPQGTGDDMGSDEIGAAAAMRLVPAEHTLPASELATEPTDPHVLPGALTPLGLSKSLSVPLTNIAERLSRSIDLETEASLPGSKGGSSSTSGESDPLPALPAATVGAASLLVLAWKAIVRFLASLG